MQHFLEVCGCFVYGVGRSVCAVEIGAATEEVTVTEAAPLLKTGSGEMSPLVTIKEVSDLPVLTITGGRSGNRAVGNFGSVLQRLSLAAAAR